VAKAKAAKPVLTREELRGPPGPSPLLVIAGLPAATAEAAARTVNNDASRWRAVAAAFPTRDGGLYEAGPILNLAKMACNFAMAQAAAEDPVPNPSRIVLAYVASDGAERLWDAFGYSVWPFALSHPDGDWRDGRHWRHDIDAINPLIQRALREVESEATDLIRLRLEAHRAEDVLLLPGRNFVLDDEERLADRFLRFMRNEADIPDIERGVRIERFPFTRLAPFFRRHGGAGKSFAIDTRELVFAKSNNGQDGGQHVIAREEVLSASRLRRELEGRFRFGTPLQPAGFQHDVQKERGALMKDIPMACMTKGDVLASGDHVNVFPSDVVTGAGVVNAKK
jgi:hypothetical protein